MTVQSFALAGLLMVSATFLSAAVSDPRPRGILALVAILLAFAAGRVL